MSKRLVHFVYGRCTATMGKVLTGISRFMEKKNKTQQ